jgi:hypothetical protein
VATLGSIRKCPTRCCLGQRLQLRLDLRPHVVAATDQEPVAAAALEVLFDAVCNQPEVLHGLVRLLALGMACVVAGVAVALAAPCQLIDEVFLLDDLIIQQLEDPRLSAVRKQNAGTLLAVQHRGQRLQMKTLADGDFWCQQLRGNVELAPELLLAAGEYGFCFPAAAMQRIDHAVDLLQVAAGGTVLAMFLRFAERVANQVLHQDGFLPVRFVGWRRGLIVKRDSATFRRPKIGEFTDVIACDHSGSPI